VLALKSGLGDIAQLVLLGHHGRERRVFTLGQQNIPEMLSVGGGKAVWPEFRQNPRWGQRVYSELKVLDLKTGRLTRLGRGQRYSAAALSADGARIVAVRTDEAYHHALVILDAATGAVIRTLPNPKNDLYQQARFSPTGQAIVVVVLSAAGKTLQLIEPTSGLEVNMLPVANVNLANPQLWGEYVLYNSPQSGVDNIYAVNYSTHETYQLTNRPTGAYHVAVAPDGRHLALHDYRATGARVVEMPLDPASWTPLPSTTPTNAPAPYVAALAAGEPGAAT
jgi:Tol biopolymer transport system component